MKAIYIPNNAIGADCMGQDGEAAKKEYQLAAVFFRGKVHALKD